MAHSTRHPPSAPGSLAQVTVPAAVYAQRILYLRRNFFTADFFEVGLWSFLSFLS